MSDRVRALVATHRRDELLALARQYGVRTFGSPTKAELVASLLNMGWRPPACTCDGPPHRLICNVVFGGSHA